MVELGHDSKYYEQYPVNLAPFRTWDMTKNATRYEDLLAAPSDEDRMLMWNLWGAIAGFAIFSTLTVFCGILSNSKVRNSPFNQYLLFLMVPDMVYTGICVVNCFLNVSRGEFYSEFMCYFQSWYAMFGVSGSAWMNALLAREIHRMLSYGQNFRRYVTPTLKQIARDSLCVLLFAAFVSSWGVWKIWLDWMPNQTVLMNGIGCFPQDFDLPTSLFFYLVFFPLLLGFPMAYVLFLGYQIWAKEMLPKQGRRRMLASFFMRLMAIYVIM